MGRKLTALPAIVTPTIDDLLYLVDNPSASPISNKISVANLFANIPSNVRMAGPDPWIDVTAPPYFATGDGTTDDTTAIDLAIAAANLIATGSSAVGCTVFFPPGLFKVSATLTAPTTGIRLLGAAGRSWHVTKYAASVIKYTLTSNNLFDLGNNVASDITFQALGFLGNSSSTDLGNNAIYTANCKRLMVIDCNFDKWGGSAVRLDAGQNTYIRGVQTDGCLLGYASLAAAQGALHLNAGESHVEDCNINACFQIGVTHGAYTSGYAAAVYINGAPGRYIGVVAAAGEIGFHIGTAVGSDSSYYFGCRAEFNQGHGFWIEGALNKFVACQAGNNSQAVDNTYDGFYTVKGAAGFPIENEFEACHVLGTSGAAYQQRYAFTDTNSSVGNTFQNVNRYDARCRLGYNVRGRKFNITGADIPAIEAAMFSQELTGTGNQTFDGEKGNIWKLTVNANTATTVKTTNLLPGQIYELEILNSSGAAPAIGLDTNFNTVGYTAPANTKRKTLTLKSDGTNLYLQGAVSADF